MTSSPPPAPNKTRLPSTYPGGDSYFNNGAPSVDRKNWWKIAVENFTQYEDVVLSVLNSLSPPEVLSLARARGPDCKTRVFDAASDDCQRMISTHLMLFDRFHLIPTKDAEEESDVLALHANDNWMWLSVDQQQKKECPGEDSVEVTIVKSDRDNEVVLRFYRYDEAFLAEIKLRERYDLLPVFIEILLSDHRGYAGGTKSLSCIAFENPDHTLELVFRKTVHGLRTPKWIKKSKIVVRQIALALKHLHEKGFVHGHVCPKIIAKYGTTWKLTNICLVTPLGSPMRGPIRGCVPPESVLERLSATTKKKVRKRNVVSFNDSFSQCSSSIKSHSKNITTFKRDDEATKNDSLLDERTESPSHFTSNGSNMSECNYSNRISCDTSSKRVSSHQSMLIDAASNTVEVVDKSCHSPHQYSTLEFSPNRCTASPAWDAWGLGLIMVQLLVGRSTNLPNFEKADDALMNNLHAFDKEALRKLHKQVLRAADADAADLVVRLLHPDPQYRPSRMGKILRHKYFTRELVTIN